MKPFRGKASGFTLVEIIIVMSIMAVSLAVALPSFDMVPGTDTATKLGRLTSDIRAAFDMSVLMGKPHRLVFHLSSGDYWLEVADRRNVFISDQKVDHDPTVDEIKEEQEVFLELFEEFEDLVGEEVRNPETDKAIKPSSPVVLAKARLRPTVWEKVENLEWGDRSIGGNLLFKGIYSEHHEKMQMLEELGPEARAFLYFFPTGYVQQSFMHIAYTKGAGEIDSEQKGYTLKTQPYEGIATVDGGYEEMEFRDDEE